MKRIWITARVAAVLALGDALLLSSTAEACRCLEVKSAAAAYKHAQAVVVGRVATITRQADDVDGADVTFKVTQAWKMDIPLTIHITTGTTCAFSFAPDGAYLLFLQHVSGEIFTTARCMGNRDTASADSFLQWLKKNGQVGKVPSAARDCAK
jgi:hypothetical protein